MMAAYDQFVGRITQRYEQARDCLAAGRYVEAHLILAGITTSHAKTSLSLRNVCIKEGFMEESR